ncbi:hypothetical protein ACIRG4_12705 [Streptomyces sp. NPDC102395]|uniref:hypothetical protein n=1 Tax=Streptomyces sp. NPDC102395 TaxID=3366168 RepID=UPI0038182D7C
MQWVRGGRSSACFEFLALTLEVKDQAFNLHSLREPLDGRGFWRRVCSWRAEAAIRNAINETLRQMRATLAVIELYGPDEVASAAHRVERACLDLTMCAEGWVRTSGLPQFDWNTELSTVQRAREEFAAAVRPHLNATGASR